MTRGRRLLIAIVFVVIALGVAFGVARVGLDRLLVSDAELVAEAIAGDAGADLELFGRSKETWGSLLEERLGKQIYLVGDGSPRFGVLDGRLVHAEAFNNGDSASPKYVVMALAFDLNGALTDTAFLDEASSRFVPGRRFAADALVVGEEGAGRRFVLRGGKLVEEAGRGPGAAPR